jgi:hypothetical protein
MTAAVCAEIADGNPARLLSAVVYGLMSHYDAEITGIPSDQWAAIIAETHDRVFRTRIECDLLEHGIAGTWRAFQERFPDGYSAPPEEDPDYCETCGGPCRDES